MRHPWLTGCLLLAVFGHAVGGLAQDPPGFPSIPVELVNQAPNRRSVVRFDVDGHALDAHDGRIAFFDGMYYLYGTSYDCGYYWTWPAMNSPFCGFKVYSSPDLTHWTDRGLLFDPLGADWQQVCGGSQGGCFRPHVVYNARDRKYVLWVNVLEMARVPQRGTYRVLSADTPTGPFTYHPDQGTVELEGLNGDQNLFVDDSGKAFVAYTHFGSPYRLVVEQLDDSYRRGIGEFDDTLRCAQVGQCNEAPSLFKHEGRYYLQYSGAPVGDGVGPYGVASTRYRTSDHPLDWVGSPETVFSTRSCEGQPSHVTPIPAPGGGTTYLYHSDLWWTGDGPRSNTNQEWRNQALANFHFEPLAFGPQGTLNEVTCAARASLEVPGRSGANTPIPHLDQTSGDQLFHAFCDIGAFSGRVRRLQVFRPARSGRLSLHVTTFQRFRPDASLFVDVVRVPAGSPPQVLATHRLSPVPDPQFPQVKWSPRVHRLDTGVTVTAGLDYGFVLRASPTTGCYGMAYSDANVYPRGRQLYSNDGGVTWRLEVGRALKFAAAVAPLP